MCIFTDTPPKLVYFYDARTFLILGVSRSATFTYDYTELYDFFQIVSVVNVSMSVSVFHRFIYIFNIFVLVNILLL